MFVKKIIICRFLPKKGQAFIFKHSNLQVCFDIEENKKLYSFGLIYKIRLKSNKQINLIFFPRKSSCSWRSNYCWRGQSFDTAVGFIFWFYWQNYRTRAIITRGLYIFYPIFEDHFFVFKEVFLTKFFPYVWLVFKSGS